MIFSRYKWFFKIFLKMDLLNLNLNWNKLPKNKKNLPFHCVVINKNTFCTRQRGLVKLAILRARARARSKNHFEPP